MLGSVLWISRRMVGKRHRCPDVIRVTFPHMGREPYNSYLASAGRREPLNLRRVESIELGDKRSYLRSLQRARARKVTESLDITGAKAL